MKIVHAVLSLDVGGLERLVLGLIREGTRRGHRVSVVCMDRLGELAKEAKHAGAELYCLDVPLNQRKESIRRSRELLQRLKPDVVHTHQIAAAWSLGQAAAALEIPVVHTEHGNHFTQSNGWIFSLKRILLYRLACQRMGRICCVSTEIADVMIRRRIASRSKFSVVANGVDSETFVDLPAVELARREFGIPNDAFVLGTVGRLVEVKRQDFLLRCAARLRVQIPNLWVLLVGDGPERQRLEALANESGLADRCVFAGFQSRPEIALRAMNVFALTSRSEGFPVSMLEAWASEIPVVASAVGGIPDVVAHQQTGLLFQPESVLDFCDAVERLHGDRAFGASIKRAALEEVQQKYSHHQMMQNYEREYRAMVRPKHGAPACAS